MGIMEGQDENQTQNNSEINISENNRFNFDADMKQLMHLIVHNFYSNRDIFLRELLSNSSDAIDKIRYNRIHSDNNSNVIDHQIKLNIDKENKILSIEDTGIGMNKEDILNNLGTIARSGTKNFMSQLENNNDLSLIGQFGVGFYSAFLVADKVKVITKKHDEDSIYEWESNGGASYYLKEDNSHSLNYGTRIELYLKDDAVNYLEEEDIKRIVKQHSQYITYPIKLLVTKS